MSDFHTFAHLVHRRFNELSKHELFVVGDDNRAFEQHYLASFPPGSNPIYKTNTEHDCSMRKMLGQYVYRSNNWKGRSSPPRYSTGISDGEAMRSGDFF